MDHTTDEQLQSFLDREDSDSERAAVMGHVETCVTCHGRLEALVALVADVSSAVSVLRPPPVERPAFAVLEARALDVDSAAPAAAMSNGAAASQAPPSLSPPARGTGSSHAAVADATPPPALSHVAATSVNPAHAGISAQTHVPGSRPRPRAVSRSSGRMAASWLRAAAVILAVTGVAGAATIVVQRRTLGRAEQAAAARPEQVDPGVIAEPQMARSGVSVMPSAGRIVVAVRGAAAGTTIDVGVAESSAASAFVRGDGEGIRYSAQTGRIDVDAAGRSIALDVRLPATATNATVEVDGQIRARKVDGGVRIERGGREVTVRARTAG